MPFAAEVYKNRRLRLTKKMEEGVAIIPTSSERTRNNDVAFPYRPDSTFYYLTGFPEPDAVLVVVAGKESKSILFCQPKDPTKEVWTGRRFGPNGAKSTFGFDETYTVDEFDKKMPGLINLKKVYYSVGRNQDFDRRIVEWMRISPAISDVMQITDEMRLIKSSEEIEIMRKAAIISAQAHRHAMQVCRPGMMEYELEAEIGKIFRFSGGDPLHAYPSIVAGGNNACVLHYTENNCVLKDGELVLIDAGCELDGYGSDITRTFPVNGKFTPEQEAVYELALEAQEAAIGKARPGNHVRAPHNAAVRVITKGLAKLRIIRGNVNELIRKRAYYRFFMHGTSHWLGSDVHDAGDYMKGGKWRELRPGMVLTVEPGIYIPIGSKGVSKKWWGIGVRIEDDVLITKNGNEVLTSLVPKTARDIELLMGR